MKTVVLLYLVAVCTGSSSAADPAEQLAPFFRRQLNDLLDQASGGWSENATIDAPKITLVKGSNGWLSMTAGHMYNLSSWSLSGDASLKCETDSAIVKAAVNFQPLLIDLYYLYENATTQWPYHELTGYLKDLKAQVTVNVKLAKLSESTASFTLQSTGSVEVSDASVENTPIKKADANTVVGRVLNEGAFTNLQNHLDKVMSGTLSDVNWASVANTCAATTTATPTATPTTPATTPTTTPTTPATTPTTTPTTPATTPTTTPTTPATTPTTTKTSVTSPSPKTEATKPKTEPATKTTAEKATTIKSPTTEKPSQPDSNEGGNSGSQDIPSVVRSDDSSEDQKQRNTLIKEFLSKTGEQFPIHNLQRYRLPDSVQELYQSEAGSADVKVTVAGLRSLEVTADPEVSTVNTTTTVTAEFELKNVKFSAEVTVESPSETWAVQGNVSQMTGQIIVVVNWSNSSAATIIVERVGLDTFVSLEGIAQAQGSEKPTLDTSQVLDGVKGAFKKNVFPTLSTVAFDPLKKAAAGKRWDVAAALATTQAPVVSTTHSSASPLTPLRAWATTLVSVFSSLLAAKMLL